MAGKKPKRRSSFTPGEILLFVAGILFCLILITTALLGGLFARYTTTSTGGDNARVAQFGDLTLTETGDFIQDNIPKKGIIIPGVNLEKSVKLSFAGSEMATILFLEVEAPGWTTTADHFTFKITDLTQEKNYLSWSLDTDDATGLGWIYLKDHVYYKELPPNTSLTDVDIIRDGNIAVSSNIKETNIGLLNNLNISFQASVIQNDGSLTPEAAWAKLSNKG